MQIVESNMMFGQGSLPNFPRQMTHKWHCFLLILCNHFSVMNVLIQLMWRTGADNIFCVLVNKIRENVLKHWTFQCPLINYLVLRFFFIWDFHTIVKLWVVWAYINKKTNNYWSIQKYVAPIRPLYFYFNRCGWRTFEEVAQTLYQTLCEWGESSIIFSSCG